MEKKTILWMILISVIILLTISFSIPVLLKASPAGTPPKSPQLPQVQQPLPPSGQEESKDFKTAISFINIGLIISLFAIYAGIYRRIRSSFTLGLMAVIFALCMYAVTSNPLIISLLGGRTGDIGLFQIVPDLCTTIALIILVRISLE